MKTVSRDGRPLAYLDSSALFKLVVPEQETAALKAALVSWPRRVSSELTVVELLLSTRRRGGGADAGALRLLANRIDLHQLDRRLLLSAGVVTPVALRSLDAIHLATIGRLARSIGVVFTYDRRLGEAVAAAGIPVEAPA